MSIVESHERGGKNREIAIKPPVAGRLTLDASLFRFGYRVRWLGGC